MTHFASLIPAPEPTISALFERVSSTLGTASHDIQAHADLFAALERATGLTLTQLFELHELLPTPRSEAA